MAGESPDFHKAEFQRFWSDGATMWVVDWNGGKLYACDLEDKTRLSDKGRAIAFGFRWTGRG